jgi:hypothetical protein
MKIKCNTTFNGNENFPTDISLTKSMVLSIEFGDPSWGLKIVLNDVEQLYLKLLLHDWIQGIPAYYILDGTIMQNYTFSIANKETPNNYINIVFTNVLDIKVLYEILDKNLLVYEEPDVNIIGQKIPEVPKQEVLNLKEPEESNPKGTPTPIVIPLGEVVRVDDLKTLKDENIEIPFLTTSTT